VAPAFGGPAGNGVRFEGVDRRRYEAGLEDDVSGRKVNKEQG